MQGEKKPFNFGLHQKYDNIAKEIILHFLNSGKGPAWKENEDRYGIDLLCEDGSVADVEVKTAWPNTDVFPFPTINVLERKKAMFVKGASLYILNICMNRALVITPEDIKYRRLVEVPNKYKPSGELFYQIPTDGLTMHRLETLW